MLKALQVSLVGRAECCSDTDNLFSVSELTYPETFQKSLHSSVVCRKTHLLKHLHDILSHVNYYLDKIILPTNKELSGQQFSGLILFCLFYLPINILVKIMESEKNPYILSTLQLLGRFFGTVPAFLNHKYKFPSMEMRGSVLVDLSGNRGRSYIPQLFLRSTDSPCYYSWLRLREECRRCLPHFTEVENMK